MSPNSLFDRRGRLVLGIILGVVTPAAFAQIGSEAAALDGRVNALDQELANEMRALRQYLTYVDQTAAIQIVLGRLTPAQAAQQLKRTAAEIYHNSFTPDALGERRREHIAAAEIMFKQIEAGIAAAVRWPTDRPGQDYRAFATKELDVQWQLFRTLRAAPVPLHEVLSDTLKIGAWTRGEATVSPAENPFAKGDERVTAALTAQHVRHVKSLNEPAANTGRPGPGVFVPTVIPPTRSSGTASAPPPVPREASLPQGLPVDGGNRPPAEPGGGGALPKPMPPPNPVGVAAQALAQGNLVLAQDLYEAALRMNPADTEAMVGLGRVQNAQGNLDAALASYEAVQRQAPSTPNLATWLAELQLAKNNLPVARQLLERELRAQPNSAWAASWLGSLELETGNMPAAQQWFQRAMQLDRNVATFRYQNATWTSGNNQPERAAREAVAALMMDPSLAGAFYAAGDSYARIGKRDWAVQYFEHYLKLDATSEWAARARERIGQLRAAAR